MSQIKNKEGTVISEEILEKIISKLHSLKYSSSDLIDYICLPLAQWLQQEGYSIENTCYVISAIVNITRIQDKINKIYDPNSPPLYPKSDLVNFLSQEEYESLEKIICPPKFEGNFNYYINSDTEIKVDFINCKIIYVKKLYNRKGEGEYRETPVIEAVPYSLTVYDSDFVELPRSFKIVWKSKHSNRLFTTAGEGIGANIKDIEKSLVSTGYSHNQKLMSDVLSATINGMIDKNLAEVKDTIDNKGVYYNPVEDKVLVVKLNTTEPSKEEILKGIDILEQVYEVYSKESTTFATIMKWSLVSIFSYAIKQTGKWVPWLYLVGAAGAGKTTLANIGRYFYDTPSEFTNIGGGSFNSDYRIGKAISEDCIFRVVNEPKATFKNDLTVETVKNSVELKVCRKVQGKVYPAFSPVIFTANNFVPEMDSLYRRLFIIDFEYNQRKSKAKKKEFEEKFNVFSPSISPLKSLNVFGQFAIREIIKDSSLLFEDWQVLADTLFEKIYSSVDMKMPFWLKEWSKDKDLDDLDNTQIENIRAILVNELYNARKKLILRGDYGTIEEFKLDGDEKSSSSKEFESLYWDLINERVFNWCVPHKPKGKIKSVFLNQGFKNLIKTNIEEIGTLKSIGQILHWRYAKVNFGKTQSRGLLVPFDEFLEFVYPSVDDDE